MVYVDVVNILGGSVHTVKENAGALIGAGKEIGLDVNVDKAKFMVTSRYQIAGRSHSMNIDNSSFERVEHFKYLGLRNSIQEEIKSTLNAGNACYHSVRNILSSSLLSIV